MSELRQPQTTQAARPVQKRYENSVRNGAHGSMLWRGVVDWKRVGNGRTLKRFGQRKATSFAPPGLTPHAPFCTHSLRCGLHSFAASRLTPRSVVHA